MTVPYVHGAVEAVDSVGPGDRVLTGDRPTGPLHLGHLVGSLAMRVHLQERVPQTILVADLQALTDHARYPEKVAAARREVVLDYPAVGIDSQRTCIALQSDIPELAELTMLYLNLVTVWRLERNPTVRQEIRSKNFGRSPPAGFLVYPVSQVADILGLGGTVVPVGADQLPMIELANEVAADLRRAMASDAVPNCRALLSGASRLPGADGRKASKTAGNALSLDANADEIQAYVHRMFTDPSHLRVEDPGEVDGNVVFAHLDALDPDRAELDRLKTNYRRGGLGDATLKRRLAAILEEILQPIRERRQELSARRGIVDEILCAGTRAARVTARDMLAATREAFGLARSSC